MTNVISLRILRPRSEHLCLISRYHPQIVGPAEFTEIYGENEILRKCIVLPPKNEETDRLTEIRPILVWRTDSPWFYNDSSSPLITTHLSFELPRIADTKLTVRRITIGGSFYGSETSGYLEAEAEVKIQTIIILDVTQCKIKVSVQSECTKQKYDASENAPKNVPKYILDPGYTVQKSAISQATLIVFRCPGARGSQWMQGVSIGR